MKICIFGSGYVGLVTGACLADCGHTVTLIDIDAQKINKLKEGIIPIFEPGLTELVIHNQESGRLHFTTDATVGLAQTRAIFVAVSTPEGEDGFADLKYVEAVTKTVANWVEAQRPEVTPLLILKSTVPVGTADRCRALVPKSVEVVSNPEFLKEGTAVADFMRPERVVIGTDSSQAREVMNEIYAPFVRAGAPILFMNNRSAEVSKYAANSFLAIKVSFINDLAIFAEHAGANIYDVRSVLTSDSRIGSKFLHPGSGYGGSCFPKDVQALAATARSLGRSLPLVEAAHEINVRQRKVIPDRICKYFERNKIAPGTLALWGVAFKPETDDIREAPALILIDELAAKGFRFLAYDPKAAESLERQRPELIRDGILKCVKSSDEALEGASALVVMTEWNEFRSPDFKKIAATLKHRVIFDGKNIYRSEKLKTLGLEHFGIGLKAF